MKPKEIREKFRHNLQGLVKRAANLAGLNRWDQMTEYTFYGGRKNILGDKINNSSALTVPVFLACAKIIAETVGSLPLPLLMPDRGGFKHATKEDEYILFHDGPNDNDTPQEFFENYITNALLTGDGMAWIDRNDRGRCDAIWPIPTDRISIRTVDGVVTYVTSMVTGKPKALINGLDMFHTKVFSRDGIRGTSIVRMASEIIGQSMGQGEYLSGLYDNGASPRGSLQTDREMTDEDIKTLREDFTKEYVGAANAGKPLILPFNLKYSAITLSPSDMAIVESMKGTDRQVCAILGVPTYMVGILDRATFNNVEQLSIQFVQQCLRKWCNRIEQSANKRVLNSGQRQRGLKFEYNLDDLLKGATKDRMEGYFQCVSTGIFTRNEVRVKEGLNPVPGGDVLLLPAGVMADPSASDEENANPDADDDSDGSGAKKEDNVLGGQPAPAPQKTPKKPAKKSRTGRIDLAEEVLGEVINKIFTKEVAVNERAATQELEERKKTIDKFYATHRQYCSKQLEKALARCYRESGKEMTAADLDAAATKTCQWNIAQVGREWNFEESAKGLTEVILDMGGI